MLKKFRLRLLLELENNKLFHMKHKGEIIMSYVFVYKQTDFDAAQVTFITSRKTMNDALATMAGFAAEMGVICRDSTYLRKIVELVENKFRTSVESWLTQEQLPFYKAIGGKDGDADKGKLKFSEAKARKILDLPKDAALDDAALAKLAGMAIGAVKATSWDSEYKKAAAVKRAAKKEEKAEEARNNTQGSEGQPISLPSEVQEMLDLILKVDSAHYPAVKAYLATLVGAATSKAA